METPIFSDAQFLGATQLNNAASVTTAGVVEDIAYTHSAGFINPENVTVTASGMVFTFTCGAFAILLQNGYLFYPLGTTAGTTSNVYTVDLTSLVPATGSQTVYIGVSGSALDQSPYTVVGPPAGHPDYNPTFAPYTAYASQSSTLIFYASTTNPTTIFDLIFAEITLTAGQSSVSPSQLVYTSQVLASSILNDTGVSAGTYTAATVVISADGRITSASETTVGGVLTGSLPNPGFATSPTFTGTTTVITLAVGGNATFDDNVGVNGTMTASVVSSPAILAPGTGFITVGTGVSTINGTLGVVGLATFDNITFTGSITGYIPGRQLGIPHILGASSGTLTIPSGANFAHILQVGGGGGGCDCNNGGTGTLISGSGGGAGGWYEAWIEVTTGSIAFTNGAGGSSQVTGGTSSITYGSFVFQAGGGVAGNFQPGGISSPGGAGGTCTLVSGSPSYFASTNGEYGTDGQSDTFIFTGNGGNSPFGPGGRAGNAGGLTAPGFAGGGGGAYDSDTGGIERVGGNGGPGLTIITFYVL